MTIVPDDKEKLDLIYRELTRSVDLKLAEARAQQQRVATLAAANGVLLGLASIAPHSRVSWGPWLQLLTLLLLLTGLVFAGLALRTKRVAIDVPLRPAGTNTLANAGDYQQKTIEETLRAWCDQMIGVVGTGTGFAAAEEALRKWMTVEVWLVLTGLLGIAVLAIQAAFYPDTNNSNGINCFVHYACRVVENER